MTENQKNCDIRIDQKIDELNVSFSKQSEEIVSLSAQVSAENKKLEERLKQQEQKIEQLQQNNADLERKTRDQTLKHNQIIQATTNLHKTAMEDQKKAYEQEKMKLYNSNIRLGETIEESSATIAERDLEIVTIKSTINLYKQQLESKSAEINEIKEDTMKLEQKIRESATQTRILNEKMKRLVEDLSNKESECSEWKLKLNHKTQECEKLVLDQTQKFKKTLQQEKETILSSINHFLMALETRKRIRGVQSAWKKYYYP
jgi:chromosome segregation ATPase